MLDGWLWQGRPRYIQSVNEIHFKAIDISIKNQDFSDYGWDVQPATNNVVTVYGHAQGLVYEKGLRRLAGQMPRLNMNK